MPQSTDESSPVFTSETNPQATPSDNNIPHSETVVNKRQGDGFVAIEKGAAPQTLLAVITDETSTTTPFDDNNISQPETIVNTNSTQNSGDKGETSGLEPSPCLFLFF